VGFVLGDNAYLTNAGVDAVGQREIDNPELTPEGNGGLGSPFCEVVKP
jgi:hypothetical protein